MLIRHIDKLQDFVPYLLFLCSLVLNWVYIRLSLAECDNPERQKELDVSAGESLSLRMYLWKTSLETDSFLLQM